VEEAPPTLTALSLQSCAAPAEGLAALVDLCSLRRLSITPRCNLREADFLALLRMPFLESLQVDVSPECAQRWSRLADSEEFVGVHEAVKSQPQPQPKPQPPLQASQSAGPAASPLKAAAAAAPAAASAPSASAPAAAGSGSAAAAAGAQASSVPGGSSRQQQLRSPVLEPPPAFGPWRVERCRGDQLSLSRNEIAAAPSAVKSPELKPAAAAAMAKPEPKGVFNWTSWIGGRD
jgi:hypothetical protein